MKSAGIAAFFAVMSTVAMAGIWELVEWGYAVVDGGEVAYRNLAKSVVFRRGMPREVF